MAASNLPSEVARALKETFDCILQEQFEPRPILIPADQVELWRRLVDGEWDDTPRCECGVQFTGGIHSDWCPCHEC